jgi:hypothetical protein
MPKLINEKIENFIINKNTFFWIYVLNEMNWKSLKRSFERNIFYVSTYTKYDVHENDVILIFQRHTTNLREHGFVSICQINSIFTENKTTSIFKDINLNKFSCKLKALELFNEPYKMTKIENVLKTQCSKEYFKSASTFNSKYTQHKSEMMRIPATLGYNIIKNFINYSNGGLNIDLVSKSDTSQCNNDDNNGDDNYSSNDSDGSDEETIFSSDGSTEYSDSDNDDIKVVLGHIPIIMDPCNSFDWNDHEFIVKKNFLKHFKTCSKCNKTNNNNCDIYPFLEKSILHFETMSDEDQITQCLSYYYNLENCVFEYEGKNKLNNHIHIFRIVLRGHIYHGCIFVMW